MKYHKVWKLIAYILVICVLFNKVNAQDTKGDNKNNNVVNQEENKNDNNNNNNNNNNNSNNNANDNINEEEMDEDDNNHGDEEMDPECSSNIGNILFQKPDSKSIIVPYSNFTLIWYYDNRGFDVNYPSRNITLMLFKSEDANYNDYTNAWKNPIYTITIPVNQTEPGPPRTDGKPVYQWDWDTNFWVNEGYTQPPKFHSQYKFRIIGDGKDITTNKANYDCYVDGDLTPGSTSSFFIVENKKLGLDYKPLVIENGGYSILKSTKLITSVIISITISLLILL